MKKKLYILISLLLALGLCACGEQAIQEPDSSTKPLSHPLIEDINWEIHSIETDGVSIAQLDYVNQSEFVLCKFELRFAASDESAATESAFGWPSISVIPENALASPGENIIGAQYYHGDFTNGPLTMGEYADVRPHEAAIVYVLDSGVYCTVYNFITESYTEPEALDMFYKYDSGKSSYFPGFPGKASISGIGMTIHSGVFYNISNDEYLEYVEKCKELGFSDEFIPSSDEDICYTEDADSYYCAYRSDTYPITIFVVYHDSYRSMSVTVRT